MQSSVSFSICCLLLCTILLNCHVNSNYNFLFVSPRSVTSLDQFAATLNLVEHRQTGEVFENYPILTLPQIKRNEIYGEVEAADKTEDQDVGDY